MGVTTDLLRLYAKSKCCWRPCSATKVVLQVLHYVWTHALPLQVLPGLICSRVAARGRTSEVSKCPSRMARGFVKGMLQLMVEWVLAARATC